MSVDISVTIDASKVTQYLGDLPPRLKNALSVGIKKSAFVIEGEAKKKTPRVFDAIGPGPSSGILVGSIHTRLLGSLSAEVATRVKYAVYVHQGTRYMRARPFMKKGLDAAKNIIRQIFNEEITSALR